jgi:multiple sugar transport system permease protein
MFPSSREHQGSLRQLQRIIWHFVRYGILLVVALFFAFPLFWMLSTSFKVPEEYATYPPTYIPATLQWNHYTRTFSAAGDGLQALRDSLIVSIGTTLLTLGLGSTAAYSMTRFGTGGSQLSFWFLSQRILPPAATILPIFLLYRALGLTDTHVGLILLHTMYNLPLCIWMLRGYFAEVPVEVEESALIEGASRIQALRLVTLPLAAPGLVATTIFVFIFSWTELFFALILTTNNVLTLPVLMSRFFGAQAYEWGAASALGVIATLPVIILGLLVRKHFVRGMTMGAVKS